MTLYAFDGTWNKDEGVPYHADEERKDDTNVVHLRNLYRDAYGEEFYKYWSGPGTRRGFMGKLFGGMFGAGGMKRVKRAIKEAEERFKLGDTVIDVLGYSRGAAIALEFAHRVTLEKFELPDGSKVQPEVRFLGLFDCVPAFGKPGNVINLGWKLCLPPGNGVNYCAHAMALDERRGNFKLKRVASKDGNQKAHEVWFRGTHGDIGGGNENTGRYCIALKWMLEQARTHGEWEIPDAELQKIDACIDPMAPIFQGMTDPRPDPFRKTRSDDLFHPTLQGDIPPSKKPLAPLPDHIISGSEI